MIHATPAIVTQAGAQRLPRWALLCLCVAYIVPGFFGREPWKNADTMAFGIMNWMAAGVIDWWHPAIPGQEHASVGLLPHWLGAMVIAAWPEQAQWIYRLPAIVAVALTLYFTWYAVFRFALLGTAQPVSFAFGGQAAPVDYARAMADSGLLALMGTLGLAQLSHEATPDVFLMASLAALLCAAARFAHCPGKTDWQALASWCGGLLAMGLSGMPWLALCVALAVPVWYRLCTPADAGDQHTLTTVTGIACLAMLCVMWWTQPWQLPGTSDSLLPPSWASFAKMLAWFTWPLWPLVLWTLWRWRHHWRQTHVGLPLLFSVLILVSSTFANGSERVVLLSLPPLAVLAAFALPTLKRSVSALIDWFSVLFFSFCAAIVWIVWLAMLTGVPEKPAANVARLAPGFTPAFEGFAFAVAVVATLCWLAVIAWRVARHPPGIWKSMVLPATGVTLCWLLLMTLWLPLLDHARSYGNMARRLAAQMPPSSCATTFGLNTAQIAGLSLQGPIKIDFAQPEASNCPYMIASPLNPNVGDVPQNGWQLVGRYNRLTDRKESLLLFQRNAALSGRADLVISENWE